MYAEAQHLMYSGLNPQQSAAYFAASRMVQFQFCNAVTITFMAIALGPHGKHLFI